MDYLSLCLICKDENDYLPEWLDYHILMGVDRFYIYDNESKVSLCESLKDYIAHGWVVVMDIPGKAVQLHAYDHCLRIFGANTFWMGFIDTDEFLVPKTCLDLKELLKDYEAYGGLAVSSLFFGSNGRKERPEIGQLAGYLTRTHETFFENSLVKSIVRTDRVLMPNTPHDFIYKPGAICVNEGFLRVDTQSFPHNSRKIQLNHYFCRSESEIDLKQSRGRGAKDAAWKRDRFERVNRHSTFIDNSVILNLERVFHIANLDTSQNTDGTKLLEHMATLVNDMRPAGLIQFVPSEVVLSEIFTNELVSKNHIVELQNQNNYDGLKEYYQELIRLFPDQIWLYKDLAGIFLKLKDLQSAWQALAHAWELAPNSYYVLNYMVYYFLRVNNFDMAEKTVHLLLEIAPHDLQALGFLTESLIGQGRFEEALKIGVPVIELSAKLHELPDKMDVYLIKKMAGYLVEKRDYHGAVHLWESGVMCQSDNVDAHLELSRVLLLAGDKTAARKWLAEARNIDPQNEDVIALLEQITPIAGHKPAAPHAAKRRR